MPAFYSEMHSVNSVMLEKVVRNDKNNRYKMIQEISKNGPVWWIRANQGHSMEVQHRFYISLFHVDHSSPSQIIMAVRGKLSRPPYFIKIVRYQAIKVYQGGTA